MDVDRWSQAFHETIGCTALGYFCKRCRKPISRGNNIRRHLKLKHPELLGSEPSTRAHTKIIQDILQHREEKTRKFVIAEKRNGLKCSVCSLILDSRNTPDNRHFKAKCLDGHFIPVSFFDTICFRHYNIQRLEPLALPMGDPASPRPSHASPKVRSSREAEKINEIASLKADVNSKANEIAFLNADHNVQAENIALPQNDINCEANDVAGLRAALDAKNNEIAALEADLNDKANEIALLKAKLATQKEDLMLSAKNDLGLQMKTILDGQKEKSREASTGKKPQADEPESDDGVAHGDVFEPLQHENNGPARLECSMLENRSHSTESQDRRIIDMASMSATPAPEPQHSSVASQAKPGRDPLDGFNYNRGDDGTEDENAVAFCEVDEIEAKTESVDTLDVDSKRDSLQQPTKGWSKGPCAHLQPEHVKSFTEKSLLTDILIISWYAILSKEYINGRSCALIDTFALEGGPEEIQRSIESRSRRNQNTNFCKPYSVLLYPNNQNKNHWVLYVIANPCSTVPDLFFLDSLGGSVEEAIVKDLLFWLNACRSMDSLESATEFAIKTPTVAQQNDDYNCGVFLCHFMELTLQQAFTKKAEGGVSFSSGWEEAIKASPDVNAYRVRMQEVLREQLVSEHDDSLLASLDESLAPNNEEIEILSSPFPHEPTAFEAGLVSREKEVNHQEPESEEGIIEARNGLELTEDEVVATTPLSTQCVQEHHSCVRAKTVLALEDLNLQGQIQDEHQLADRDGCFSGPSPWDDDERDKEGISGPPQKKGGEFCLLTTSTFDKGAPETDAEDIKRVGRPISLTQEHTDSKSKVVEKATVPSSSSTPQAAQLESVEATMVCRNEFQNRSGKPGKKRRPLPDNLVVDSDQDMKINKPLIQGSQQVINQEKDSMHHEHEAGEVKDGDKANAMLGIGERAKDAGSNKPVQRLTTQAKKEANGKGKGVAIVDGTAFSSTQKADDVCMLRGYLTPERRTWPKAPGRPLATSPNEDDAEPKLEEADDIALKGIRALPEDRRAKDHKTSASIVGVTCKINESSAETLKTNREDKNNEILVPNVDPHGNAKESPAENADRASREHELRTSPQKEDCFHRLLPQDGPQKKFKEFQTQIASQTQAGDEANDKINAVGADTRQIQHQPLSASPSTSSEAGRVSNTSTVESPSPKHRNRTPVTVYQANINLVDNGTTGQSNAENAKNRPGAATEADDDDDNDHLGWNDDNGEELSVLTNTESSAPVPTLATALEGNKEAASTFPTELWGADKVMWVQCDKCRKWRTLPAPLNATDLPDVWYCPMNTWNPTIASCDDPDDNTGVIATLRTEHATDRIARKRRTSPSEHPTKGKRIKKSTQCPPQVAEVGATCWEAHASRNSYVKNLIHTLLGTKAAELMSNGCSSYGEFTRGSMDKIIAMLRSHEVLKKEHNIMDFGCGAATFLTYVCQEYGCNGVGVEYDLNRLKITISFVKKLIATSEENAPGTLNSNVFLKHVNIMYMSEAVNTRLAYCFDQAFRPQLFIWLVRLIRTSKIPFVLSVKGHSETSYRAIWVSYGYELIDSLTVSKAKIPNGSSTNTIGLFKLRENGPSFPEYNWDDHHHELKEYSDNEKNGGDCLFAEAQAFFDASLDDKIRTYTDMLNRLIREAEKEKQSRSRRTRKIK
mmetsp:Transcript_63053/g.176352  ORF Transcript_63053/g.176352 Transcript_63053/m.176352 type:complete len:1653 (-) Transcript_63053:26-4984(-)